MLAQVNMCTHARISNAKILSGHGRELSLFTQRPLCPLANSHQGRILKARALVVLGGHLCPRYAYLCAAL